MGPLPLPPAHGFCDGPGGAAWPHLGRGRHVTRHPTHYPGRAGPGPQAESFSRSCTCILFFCFLTGRASEYTEARAGRSVNSHGNVQSSHACMPNTSLIRGGFLSDKMQPMEFVTPPESRDVQRLADCSECAFLRSCKIWGKFPSGT